MNKLTTSAIVFPTDGKSFLLTHKPFGTRSILKLSGFYYKPKVITIDIRNMVYEQLREAGIIISRDSLRLVGIMDTDETTLPSQEEHMFVYTCIPTSISCPDFVWTEFTNLHISCFDKITREILTSITQQQPLPPKLDKRIQYACEST